MLCISVKRPVGVISNEWVDMLGLVRPGKVAGEGEGLRSSEASFVC